MASRPYSTENHLLNAMTADDRERLFARMERIDLHRGLVLVEQDAPAGPLYFMEDGIASVVICDGKNRVEIGIIGKEGAVGTAALLGQRRARAESFIQVDGRSALKIGLDDMCAAFRDSVGIRDLMLAFVHCYTLQVSHAVLSGAQYSMEARLARWLLMCHDRMEGDQIALTHEFMAQMISAQRSGVTVTLHVLEGMGVIRSSRGLVTILDRDKLADLAGPSYGQPEEEYRALIGAFGKRVQVASE